MNRRDVLKLFGLSALAVHVNVDLLAADLGDDEYAEPLETGFEGPYWILEVRSGERKKLRLQRGIDKVAITDMQFRAECEGQQDSGPSRCLVQDGAVALLHFQFGPNTNMAWYSGPGQHLVARVPSVQWEGVGKGVFVVQGNTFLLSN